MRDTSKPGAQYVGQAYFKGCVDILRSLDGLDFSLLYSGQIALQDLKRANHLIRRDNVRLPRFLSNERRYRAYWQHCIELLRVNRLDKPAVSIGRAPRLSAGRKIETRRGKSVEPAGSTKRSHSFSPPSLSRTMDAGGFAGASTAASSDVSASSSAKAALSRTAAGTFGAASNPSLSHPAASKRSASASPAPTAKARAKSAARKAKAKKKAAPAQAASPDATPSPEPSPRASPQSPPFFARPSVGTWVVRSFEEGGEDAEATAEAASEDDPPPPPASELADFAAKHRSKCRLLQVVKERRLMAMHDVGEASMCDCCG